MSIDSLRQDNELPSRQEKKQARSIINFYAFTFSFAFTSVLGIMKSTETAVNVAKRDIDISAIPNQERSFLGILLALNTHADVDDETRAGLTPPIEVSKGDGIDDVIAKMIQDEQPDISELESMIRQTVILSNISDSLDDSVSAEEVSTIMDLAEKTRRLSPQAQQLFDEIERQMFQLGMSVTDNDRSALEDAKIIKKKIEALEGEEVVLLRECVHIQAALKMIAMTNLVYKELESDSAYKQIGSGSPCAKIPDSVLVEPTAILSFALLNEYIAYANAFDHSLKEKAKLAQMADDLAQMASMVVHSGDPYLFDGEELEGYASRMHKIMGDWLEEQAEFLEESIANLPNSLSEEDEKHRKYIAYVLKRHQHRSTLHLLYSKELAPEEEPKKKEEPYVPEIDKPSDQKPLGMHGTENPYAELSQQWGSGLFSVDRSG